MPSEKMWRNSVRMEHFNCPNILEVCLERLMKQMMMKKNTEELLSWSETYKKVDTEQYRKKELKLDPEFRRLNLQDSRIFFRKTCFLLQTVRLNFKSNKQYKAESYLCPDCLSLDPPVSHPDDQASLLTCQGNSDLRVGRDLGDLKQEIDYYRSIIARRTQKYGWHTTFVYFILISHNWCYC